MMGALKESISSAVDLKTIFGAATILGIYWYKKPPAFGRALWLLFRSRLFANQNAISQRKSDLRNIKTEVDSLQYSYDRFLVVRGPKGIGKTTAIETALNHTWGVCFVQNTIVPGKKNFSKNSQVYFSRLIE